MNLGNARCRLKHILSHIIFIVHVMKSVFSIMCMDMKEVNAFWKLGSFSRMSNFFLKIKKIKNWMLVKVEMTKVCLISCSDVYLLGTVMLVFGMGLYELFVSNLDTSKTLSDKKSPYMSNLFGLFTLKVSLITFHSLC